MKYLFAGGGTGGPTTALIAIQEEIQKNDPYAEFLLLGDAGGISQHVLESSGIPYRTIHAGKFRRYISLKNITDIFRSLRGCYEARKIMQSWKPDVIISAGSFVAVPVVAAGYFLDIPSIIHQQDVQPSLTNKILKRFATHITLAFEGSIKDFPREKTTWTGNPVREQIRHGRADRMENEWSLEKDIPVLLIMGGGTGSRHINHIIEEVYTELLKYCQIIHITGPGKNLNITNPRYHAREFIGKEFADVVAASDVVITRAGMGSLSELAMLKKAAIVIPIPNSHQEANARYLGERGAVMVLDQRETHLRKFVDVVKKLLEDQNVREEFGGRLSETLRVTDAGKNIVHVIQMIMNKKI